MIYRPLPKYLQSQADHISNFGLYFQKYFPYILDKDKGELKTEDSGKNTSSIKYVINAYAPDYKLINLKNQIQDNFIKTQKAKGVEVVNLQAKLISRLVPGIGETSPLEVGMSFDRNSGIPYIPSSTIKGAVSYAYCINYVQDKQDPANDPYIKVNDDKLEFQTEEPGFTLLFGSRESNSANRGGFCFLDAYAQTCPELVIDIMNPHFGSYYSGTNPPVETESPIPIKFLAVEKGIVFNFRGFFLNKKAVKYKDLLSKAFRTALTSLGLGAKTATGYGLFEIEKNYKLGNSGNKKTKLINNFNGKNEIKKYDPEKEIIYEWENATLSWAPNTGTVHAAWQGKKASGQGKELVPEKFHNKLFKKRKTAQAKVKVKTVGNSFEIIEIE